MKFTCCLALAIMALLNSVAAIYGTSMNMIANSKNGSSFTAMFHDYSDTDTLNQILSFDTVLSGDVGEYTNMQCSVELDVSSSRRVADRIFRISDLTEYRYHTTGYVGFKSAIRLRSGDVLGTFKLACSFIPLKDEAKGLTSTVYASINTDKAYITTAATIRPFNGYADSFHAYISSTRSEISPTTFKIINPHVPATLFRHTLRIRNPPMTEASSSSRVTFKSNSRSSKCDAYRDGVFYPDSVTANMADGSLFDLVFSSPIHTSSEIVIRCVDVFGRKTNPFLPAIIESVNIDASLFSYSNYAIVTSSADQISFSDFLPQTVETSPIEASHVNNSLELLELLL